MSTTKTAAYRAKKARKRKRDKAVKKQYIAAYLSTHCCVDCGESDPIVLEFDHVTGHKRSNISKMVSQGTSLLALKHEIEKCVVRCANCHRRKTIQNRDYENTPEPFDDNQLQLSFAPKKYPGEPPQVSFLRIHNTGG